jgi:8-oxo-dGTP diphosphatase
MAGNARRKFTYDYPRPALTVDAALVTREARPRVLLIQRAGEPFKGLWALPGGFVEENERLNDAASRELFEETGIRFTDLEQLYAAGDPGRDPRGWTVGVAYLARVEPDQLKAIAGDDASAVKWFPLDRLPKLAFDHAMLLARVKTRLADRSA